MASTTPLRIPLDQPAGAVFECKEEGSFGQPSTRQRKCGVYFAIVLMVGLVFTPKLAPALVAVNPSTEGGDENIVSLDVECIEKRLSDGDSTVDMIISDCERPNRHGKITEAAVGKFLAAKPMPSSARISPRTPMIRLNARRVPGTGAQDVTDMAWRMIHRNVRRNAPQMEKLKQRYAVNSIIKHSEEDGFQITDMVKNADGSVKVKLQRSPVGIAASSAASLKKVKSLFSRHPVPQMSHLSHVKLLLKDKAALKKALEEMGLTVNVQENAKTPLQVKSQKGHMESVEILVKQDNGYDIGFAKNGDNYELVTDSMFWQQPVTQDIFLEKLKQRYAVNAIINHSKEDGFQINDMVTNADGTVKVKLQRFAAA